MIRPVSFSQTPSSIEEGIKKKCVSVISKVALSSLIGIAGFVFFSRNYALLLTAGIVCYNITDLVIAMKKNKRVVLERPRADSYNISEFIIFALFLISLITLRYDKKQKDPPSETKDAVKDIIRSNKELINKRQGELAERQRRFNTAK